jgi:SAM-dependent methyltransferase
MSTDTYLLGRSEREYARLARQAALVEPETEDLLRRAGIAAGMHVLEAGSGTGDMARLAGRLVMPGGAVVGVEQSEGSVALARKLTGGDQPVTFEIGDLDRFAPAGRFDALIGRFVLAYLSDPVATLRRLAAYVRPGGVIAFLEFDVTCIACAPEAPLFRRVADWITCSYTSRGAAPGLGSALGSVFRDAGLPWPSMSSFQKVSCGPDGIVWYFAELVRTLLPHIVQSGTASAEEVEIDSLETRLLEEAVALNLTVFSPRWTSAWVRQPSLGAGT